MFTTLSNFKSSNVPINLQLELFDKIVMPCMLFEGEVFGFKNNPVLERFQMKNTKYALISKVLLALGVFKVKREICLVNIKWKQK